MASLHHLIGESIVTTDIAMGSIRSSIQIEHGLFVVIEEYDTTADDICTFLRQEELHLVMTVGIAHHLQELLLGHDGESFVESGLVSHLSVRFSIFFGR